MDFSSMQLPAAYDILAPDTSEIRYLSELDGGSMVHCTLKPGRVSLAIRHETVEEIWYVLSGTGEIWRKHGQQEEVMKLQSGVSLTIPLGTHFQFRNIGDDDLCIVLITMPPWPGAHEAIRVPDYWSVS